MESQLEYGIDDNKHSTLEVIAIKLELEDEQLRQWRESEVKKTIKL